MTSSISAGLDARARDGLAHHVRCHRYAVRLVERAACGASDARAAVGDDGNVFHRARSGKGDCRAAYSVASKVTIAPENSLERLVAIERGENAVDSLLHEVVRLRLRHHADKRLGA